MPKFNVILNLPGFSIEKASGYHPIVLDVITCVANAEALLKDVKEWLRINDGKQQLKVLLSVL